MSQFEISLSSNHGLSRTKLGAVRQRCGVWETEMRIITTLAFAAMLTSTVVAHADQPGADWMSATQLKQKLMDGGYTSITSLEADDGHWEGEGVKGGKKMQFHADPKTGAITSEKPND